MFDRAALSVVGGIVAMLVIWVVAVLTKWLDTMVPLYAVVWIIPVAATVIFLYDWWTERRNDRP